MNSRFPLSIDCFIMANIIEITDISAPELTVYTRLTEAQLKNRLNPQEGLFIAESPKVSD